MAKQEGKKIKTDSGIPVKRSFSSKDLTSISQMMKKQANFRIQGAYTLTCIEKDSGMRQYSGFGSAEETNKRFRFLLIMDRLACHWLLISNANWKRFGHEYSQGEVGGPELPSVP